MSARQAKSESKTILTQSHEATKKDKNKKAFLCGFVASCENWFMVLTLGMTVLISFLF
jgi:arginine exporter protein ArgO